MNGEGRNEAREGKWDGGIASGKGKGRDDGRRGEGGRRKRGKGGREREEREEGDT